MASKSNEPADRRVTHSYHDFATITEDCLSEVATVSAGDRSEGDVKSSNKNFPVKLHDMVTQLEQDGLEYIVGWQPHGRCFVVHKQEAFVRCILPLWFRQTKLPSFQRQLNLYGFNRITSGKDKGGYYNDRFLRGKRFLSHTIKRYKVKGEGMRKPASPETEPRFYNMPHLPNNAVSQKPAKEIHHAGVVAPAGNLFLARNNPGAPTEQLLAQQLQARPPFGADKGAGRASLLPSSAAVQPPPGNFLTGTLANLLLARSEARLIQPLLQANAFASFPQQRSVASGPPTSGIQRSSGSSLPHTLLQQHQEQQQQLKQQQQQQQQQQDSALTRFLRQHQNEPDRNRQQEQQRGQQQGQQLQQALLATLGRQQLEAQQQQRSQQQIRQRQQQQILQPQELLQCLGELTGTMMSSARPK